MRRTLFTLVAVLALCAWAGAQAPPASLSAATQVKQFKNNRLLIETLVDHGIDLADADSSLKRAEVCRQTARTLANALNRAADDQNPDRVAELANLFGDVVRDGLVPNLDHAKKSIPPQSPDAKRLREVNDWAKNDLSEVRKALEMPGKVGDSDKVKAALKTLESLKLK
jgi:hypothetical protein